MHILNFNVEALETMSQKDAFAFVNAIIQKFHTKTLMYSTSYIQFPDKVNNNMMYIQLLIKVDEVFNSKLSSTYFMVSSYRAIDWSCSNAIMFDEMNASEYAEEFKYQQRLKCIMNVI